MIKNVEIKVYPLILESDQASALWHLMRALDINGSGKVSLTLTELINMTGYSKATIYRYMKSNLFSKVVKTKNKRKEIVYSFYYKSLKQVALTLGINNLITSSFCMWEDIKQFYTKRVTATEIIAQSIQNRSKYCARISKNKNQKLISLTSVFREEDSLMSDNTQGITTNNCLIYSDKDYAPYGASQKTIGTCLKRTIRTINRRLKNTPKVKQFINTAFAKKDNFCLQMLSSGLNRELHKEKYTIINNEVYKRYTNLYSPQYCLKMKKLSFKSSNNQKGLNVREGII